MYTICIAQTRISTLWVLVFTTQACFLYTTMPYIESLSPPPFSFHDVLFRSHFSFLTFLSLIILYIAVEIGEWEYCFSMGGIGKLKPATYDNQGSAKFKTKIFMGDFSGNLQKVLTRLKNEKFRENSYELTLQNCNHFRYIFYASN